MFDKLVALAKLAEMDDSARDIEAELSKIPQQLEELRRGVQTLETLLAQERNQISDAQELKERQKSELQERSESLVRARKKMAQASTMKEAEAAEREMEINRRSLKEREEEAKRITDAIEAKTTSLGEREKEFEEAGTLLSQEEEAAKARTAELEAEKAKLLSGRDELAARIPNNVVRRYERLRKALTSAVAILAEDTCSGCRMALPPQLYIELQRGEDFHQCPHCKRIVIYREHVLEQAPEPTAQSNQA